MEPDNSKSDSYLVKLCVGGKRFITTKDTLSARGPNFLSALVENDATGRMKALKDEKGFIFVDRSGLLFEYVLDFLRSGSLQMPPGVSRTRMLEELDYYQIKLDLGTNTSSNRPRSAQTDAALKPDFERALLAELRQLSATSIQRVKPATIAFMNKYMVFLTEHMRMAATQGLVSIDFSLEENYSETLRTMAAKAIVSYGPHSHSLGPERAELFEERWILYELELIVPELYGIQAKMTKKSTVTFSWASRMGVDVDPL